MSVVSHIFILKIIPSNPHFMRYQNYYYVTLIYLLFKIFPLSDLLFTKTMLFKIYLLLDIYIFLQHLCLS